MVRAYDGNYGDDEAYTEVDPYGPEAEHLKKLRVMLVGTLDLVTGALHEGGILQPGEQLTIPLTVDCGMVGRLVIQLDQPGDCSGPLVEPVRVTEVTDD